MMRELRRYRLFLTFLLVPLFILALIVILVVNAFFGGDGAEVDVAVATPTPVVTAAPVATIPPDPGPATVAPAPATPAPTPLPTAIPPVVQTPAPAPAPDPAPTQPPAGVYTVQSGDTLFDIASRLGVTVADLAEYNNLTDPGQIFAGQELQIPPEGSAAPEPADTSVVATVSTGGAQLNVRDAPSLTNSQVVTQLADGDQVQLTGQTQQVDGVTWYETANGNWLHGDFLILP